MVTIDRTDAEMFSIYKYLMSGDAKFIMDEETLMFSSARYFERDYAAMETVKNPFIYDPYEGKTIHYQSHAITSETQDVNEIAALSRVIGGISPEDLQRMPGLKLSGNVIIDVHSEFLMCCFTFLGPEDGGDIFLQKGDGMPGYDACIAFDDPYLLQEIIVNEGVFLLPSGERIGLQEMAHDVSFNEVSYEDIAVSWRQGPPIAPSAFRKHPIFHQQREFRVAVTPRIWMPERVVLHLPGLSMCTKRLF